MQEGSLTVFQTDEAITLSFKDRVYTIWKSEPFYNIARLCLERNDYIPFYVEIARREGLGPEFRDRLLEEIARLQQQGDGDS